MKTIAISLMLCLASPCLTHAQNQATSWEDRKAERLKPVSASDRAAISQAVPDRATAKPAKPRRVLLFYRCEGFIHTSIPHCTFAVQEMARKTGAFAVDVADNYEVFTDENLGRYDGIVLNNSSGMKFPTPSHLNAFLDFVSSGKGLAGFHAASDNFGSHPRCLAMIGGIFGGHPWNAGGTWAFQLDDPSHVLNDAFDGEGFWHRDEIYQYKPESYEGPEKLRILVSLDMTKTAVTDRIDDGPRQVPVSWLRKAGEGRVFYTNFGHREETYQHPKILRHMLDGIQYSLGDLPADDAPTAALPAKSPATAPDAPGEQ